MTRKPFLRAAVAAMLLSLGFAGSAFAEAVRAEVGKPLQEAQALIKSGKGREALAKINQAEAAPNRTANENYLIQQMRLAAANAAGDNEATIKAGEGILSSGRAQGAELLRTVQTIAVAYYKNKEYAKAAQWTQRYFKEGGTDSAMRTMQLQSYYLSNNCNEVSRMLGPVTEEGNGRRASEEELQILARCY